MPHQPPSAAARAAVALAAALSAAACSLLARLESSQCESTADCRARGAPFATAVCNAGVCEQDAPPRDDAAASAGDAGDAGDASDWGPGPWGCLGSKHLPEVDIQPITIRAIAYDVLATGNLPADGYIPVPNVKVRACLKLDAYCARPLTETLTLDDAGTATLALPQNRDVFFEIQGGAWQPALFYYAVPLTDAVYYFPLLQKSVLPLFAQGLKTTFDSALGIVFVSQADCRFAMGAWGAGVTYQLDSPSASTVPFFYVDGLPSRDAVKTDGRGTGGFVNVPVGLQVVKSRLFDTGQPIATANILVRPNWISNIALMPYP